MSETLLRLEHVTTSFRIDNAYYPAVDDLSLTVNNDEVLAIVGESGCGKSALALSIMQLHRPGKTSITGHIYLKGQDLLSASRDQLDKIRGKDIGMIFQDSLTALNPLMTVEKQITENMDYHLSLNNAEKRAHVLELLTAVGIHNPERIASQYPHELSGGMRQRVMIALAVACNPELVIADEPTTALDVTIQAQVIALLKKVQKDRHSGIILITHNLGVVAEMADRVAVMYAGQIVEMTDVMTLFANPLHPYTRSLLNSIPSATSVRDKLHVIQGIVPSIQHIPHIGCRFAPRIPWVEASEHEANPQLHEAEPGHWVRCTCYRHFSFPDNLKEGDVQDVLS
ncbi:MAG: ABC transporter ATP-binding protein [Sporolactobacillus sp.]